MPHSETAKIRQYVWPWIKDGKGVDLGCGFDKVHPRCIGMDSIKTPTVDVVGNITDLSRWGNEEFDWIFSSHAIEDIPDTEGTFREWLRVLRLGGTFIVYCPYRHYYPNIGQPGANQDHVHDFVPSEIVAALRAADPDVWIVTAEVRGHERTDEFHEYSCLVIARKGRPERPAVLIENNHQIGDTISAAPLCGILRDILPDCEITMGMDKTAVLMTGTVDRIGKEDRAYDLIVHQRTSATERGDWLRRTTHFTQFTARACAEIFPEVIAALPDNPQKAIALPYRIDDADLHGLPEIPIEFVAIAMETHSPRCWSHEKWSKLIGWLLDREISVVAIGMDATDVLDERVLDLRGMTTFRQAAAAMSFAKVLVSVDTSFVHVAHSLGVPCAVLMGPSDFRTTFYDDTVPIRRPNGCVGCYNWTSNTKYVWSESDVDVPAGESLREGRQMPMYERAGCRDFMSGVECMSAIRLSDVFATVGKMLGIAPPERRKLTAAYIVLNEEDNLPRSLEAIVGLADAVVVVDTGSTDHTVEIAQDWSERTDIPLKVAEFKWRDDFAAAKNFAVEQVETSHFIWLDADDIMENPIEVRDAFDSSDHDVYHLLTDLGPGGRFRRERIAPSYVRWLYPVHECLDIRGLDGTYIDSAVLHRPTKAEHWIGSLERNERILKAWLEKEPESDRATFYLAETLRQRGESDAAAALYETHYVRSTDWRESLLHSAYQVARHRLHTRKWEEAIKWGLEAIRTDSAWREGYYVVGDAHFWMGDYTTAYAWFIAAHNLPRPDRSLWKEETIYSHLPATQLSYCCERCGNLASAISWAEEAALAGGDPLRPAELRSH